jgi:hypothetical protein
MEVEVVDDAGEEEEVHSVKDLHMLERLQVDNANEDTESSDLVGYDMIDSDDEDYDPANPDYDEYF